MKLAAVRKKKGRRWTSEQARRFLASALEDGDPYYAAYVLIYTEVSDEATRAGLKKLGDSLT